MSMRKGQPRLPGNLHGISFAIANCTGLLVRVMETCAPVDAYREFLAH